VQDPHLWLFVLITFAIGSALAAFAGIMNGLYYNEINFTIGLYLGVTQCRGGLTVASMCSS